MRIAGRLVMLGCQRLCCPTGERRVSHLVASGQVSPRALDDRCTGEEGRVVAPGWGGPITDPRAGRGHQHFPSFARTHS